MHRIPQSQMQGGSIITTLTPRVQKFITKSTELYEDYSTLEFTGEFKSDKARECS